eukprot:Nk52_evm20s153 gene=Nk52_evmTU20s153
MVNGAEGNVEEDICRVCRSPGSPSEPLFHPCRCTGSIRFVHQPCLMRWLKTSSKTKCELCHYPFAFSPVYAGEIPAKLPMKEFLWGLWVQLGLLLMGWLRIFVVVACWLGVLPFITTKMFRFVFFLEEHEQHTITTVIGDVIEGCFVSGCSILMLLGILGMRDFLMTHNVNMEEELLGDNRGRFDQAIRQRHEEIVNADNDALRGAGRAEGRQVHHHGPRLGGDGMDEDMDRRNNDIPVDNVEERVRYRQMAAGRLLRNARNSMGSMEDEEDDDSDSILGTFGSRGGGGEDFAESSSRRNSSSYSRFEHHYANRLSGAGSSSSVADKQKQPLRKKSDEGDANSADWEDDEAMLQDEEFGKTPMVVHIRRRIENAQTESQRAPLLKMMRQLYKKRLIESGQMKKKPATNSSEVDPRHFRGDIGQAREEVNVRPGVLHINRDGVVRLAGAPDEPEVPLPNVADLHNEDSDGEDDEDEDENVHGGFGLGGLFNNDNNNEEATFAELVGLRGPIRSLFDNMFWLLLLNTVIFTLFVTCPYLLGSVFVSLSPLGEAKDTKLLRLVTTLIGYGCWAVIGAISLFVSSLVTTSRNRTMGHVRSILNFFFTFFKVAFLMSLELLVFPLLCGWWLDICTLESHDASVQGRRAFYNEAPVTSSFLHWLVGILYMFHFASFVSVNREVLRPGVLWFLRNPQDTNFHPIREMIELPTIKHGRRLLLSAVMYGLIIFLTIWVPLKACKYAFPSVFPLNILFRDPISEVPVDLLIFHIVVPSTIDRCHPKKYLKIAIEIWADKIGTLLSLKRYLLVDPVLDHEARNAAGAEVADNLPESHPLSPMRFKPKTWFKTRILALVVLLWFSVSLVICVLIFSPVLVGRSLFKCFTDRQNHEFYTFGVGLYAIAGCLISIGWLVRSLKNPNWARVCQVVKNSLILGAKCVGSTFVFLMCLPLLLGLMFDVTFVMPLRVPIDESPVFFLLQDWAVGVICMKVLHKLIALGPNNRFKVVMERIRENGVARIDFNLLVFELAFPIIQFLGTFLSVPYVIARGIFPYVGVPQYLTEPFLRYFYAFLALAYSFYVLQASIYSLFVSMHNKIRDERYLVGETLINYGENPSAQVANRTSTRFIAAQE